MEEFKIKDESGDRKYFTQIPNIIINHSSSYEQSLYLIMKCLAGERGSCYASINWLATKMRVAKRTVNSTIDNLLKKKWIEEISLKQVNGGKVRQFTIVDIWELNVLEYKGGTHLSTFNNTEVEPTVTTGGTQGSSGGTHVHTNKIYKEDLIKNTNIYSGLTPAGKEINLLIAKFKVINPSYERLFKNKNQRAALERMMKKFSLEELSSMIDILPQTNSKQYSPVITTPLQLEEKVGQLVNFLNREKNNQPKIVNV